jgi:hypothetical protein
VAAMRSVAARTEIGKVFIHRKKKFKEPLYSDDVESEFQQTENYLVNQSDHCSPFPVFTEDVCSSLQAERINYVGRHWSSIPIGARQGTPLM